MTDKTPAPPLPDFTEERLSSNCVYRGGFLNVFADRVRLPDGAIATREYVHHPGAAIILPFLDENTIVLEHQFRYPVGRHFIELPAGKIDAGEAPLATAQRELREECGYAATDWRHLTTTFPCIGYSDERIEMFVARGLQSVGHARDPGEFLEVLTVELAEALAWVRAGRITDVKTMLGLLWAEKISAGAPGW